MQGVIQHAGAHNKSYLDEPGEREVIAGGALLRLHSLLAELDLQCINSNLPSDGYDVLCSYHRNKVQCITAQMPVVQCNNVQVRFQGML